MTPLLITSHAIAIPYSGKFSWGWNLVAKSTSIDIHNFWLMRNFRTTTTLPSTSSVDTIAVVAS